ncbi:sigma-70 family RNA polymerase sigma factor [Dyadobacter sp. 676]|uniref:Sigma-70 family RNA polymerase sigma factor n=1 Tax=Dyadobacter sp. 676 TaxID=3088362 RepID=A0AAU8FIK0_9BACT
MNLLPQDELHLWRRIQAGDGQAFQELHQIHIRHLLNYGLRLCGSMSTVEDCVQDVFAELWLYRQGITQPISMRFYLLKALRNKLKAQYRKEHSFISGWDDDRDNIDRPVFNVEPSTEQNLIDLDIEAEREQQIRAAMNALSPRQREIIYLRYFNDLTYDQICELLNINYQTARSQIYHSLKILRNTLNGNDLRSTLSFLFFF